VKYQFSAGGCRINVLGKALKADLAVVELSDAGDEVFEGAAKPVKLPDNQAVTGANVGKCFI
jgi:hypothetical protein